MNFKGIFRRAYKGGIFLKCVDGIFEFILGIFLLFVPLSSFSSFISRVFSHELIEDPKDILANSLIHFFQVLPVGISYFWVAYFFAHGIIKLGLVFELSKGRKWIYPWAVGILSFFIIYQVYLMIVNFSIIYPVLIIVDFVIVSFIIWDWKELRNKVR